MRRSEAFRRIARLVVVALLAQSWLGQWATAAAARQLDAVVICTGTGFKIVGLQDDLGPLGASSDEQPTHDTNVLDCTSCLVKTLSQLRAENVAVWVHRYAEAAERLAVTCRPAAHRLRHSPLQSRAPPVV